MEKRKLIIAQNLHKELVSAIEEIIPEWDLIVGKEKSIWQDHLQDAEIIAGWQKDMAENVLADHTKLRWIQSWSAGINNMPLEDFKSRKILLTSANGVHSFPISETIFALMLGLTRKIHTYVRNQQTKKWHHSGLRLELHGKTMGLFGVGAIGRETAKIAKAFGMNVLGFRRSGETEDYVDKIYTLEQMNDVLPQCDYVVVTLPLTNETKQLFGKEQFKRMKPSSFFINIGRGDLVVESELIQALQDDKIAGAGLDVFEKEPLSEDNPLWELENVIITPHTAGSTEHYDHRVIEDIFIPNLKSYLQNEELPINLVDYLKGY